VPRELGLKRENEFSSSPFEIPLTRDAQGRSLSSIALQRFIAAGDLSVVFQPIFDAATLKIFAHEALVRCTVPEFSNPSKLFDRAAKEGCCGRLGRLIREIAVPNCAGIPLFLNLHPQELQQRWLVQPDDPMFFHDADVFLEITESVPLTHYDLCFDVLREVRSRGRFFLVVDDLGAGYSNLKRIADLEPHVVKLDRDLIQGVTKKSRQQTLVKGVVDLCVSLGAKVVAEGIETAEEFEALRETGIHFVQGFLFARPDFPPPGLDPKALPLAQGMKDTDGPNLRAIK
jgi:EAL domain-containing protein (putative c-di-GMP-specific phosphodiesterase class I)